jgi:GNAT superfamily N-acetyltransferase
VCERALTATNVTAGGSRHATECEQQVTGDPGRAHVEFLAQPFDTAHAALLLASTEVTAEALRGVGEDDGGAFLVAYVNGQPTGCGGYRVFAGDPSGDTVEILGLYVRAGSRRSGLARAILAELESWAVHDGYTRVVALVEEARSGAHAVLQTAGYRHADRPGEDRSGHFYGKQLAGARDSPGCHVTARDGNR